MKTPLKLSSHWIFPGQVLVRLATPTGAISARTRFVHFLHRAGEGIK